ncbi:hypothetical protein EV127DRAFT_434498 [Xylaria flabelliformis]|nr:hypothetical protein EV127DRAFT_434498 [Xylaria flabelliformis]
MESWPLVGTCDIRSVDFDDLVPTDIVNRRYVGETCFGKYTSKQKWYYFSGHDVNEISILKIYDLNKEAKPDVSYPSFATKNTLKIKSQFVYIHYFRSLMTQGWI